MSPEEERRFCTSCQRHQPSEGGFKKPSSPRAWMCRGCHERTTPSIYKARRPSPPAKIERLLGSLLARAAGDRP